MENLVFYKQETAVLFAEGFAEKFLFWFQTQSWPRSLSSFYQTPLEKSWKATMAKKNMQHQRHELKQCLHGHTHTHIRTHIYDAYQAASINWHLHRQLFPMASSHCTNTWLTRILCFYRAQATGSCMSSSPKSCARGSVSTDLFFANQKRRRKQQKLVKLIVFF